MQKKADEAIGNLKRVNFIIDDILVIIGDARLEQPLTSITEMKRPHINAVKKESQNSTLHGKMEIEVEDVVYFCRKFYTKRLAARSKQAQNQRWDQLLLRTNWRQWWR